MGRKSFAAVLCIAMIATLATLGCSSDDADEAADDQSSDTIRDRTTTTEATTTTTEPDSSAYDVPTVQRELSGSVYEDAYFALPFPADIAGTVTLYGSTGVPGEGSAVASVDGVTYSLAISSKSRTSLILNNQVTLQVRGPSSVVGYDTSYVRQNGGTILQSEQVDFGGIPALRFQVADDQGTYWSFVVDADATTYNLTVRRVGADAEPEFDAFVAGFQLKVPTSPTSSAFDALKVACEKQEFGLGPSSNIDEFVADGGTYPEYLRVAREYIQAVRDVLTSQTSLPEEAMEITLLLLASDVTLSQLDAAIPNVDDDFPSDMAPIVLRPMQSVYADAYYDRDIFCWGP